MTMKSFVAIVFMLTVSTSAFSQGLNYQGKTITIVAGTNAGSVYDAPSSGEELEALAKQVMSHQGGELIERVKRLLCE